MNHKKKSYLPVLLVIVLIIAIFLFVLKMLFSGSNDSQEIANNNRESLVDNGQGVKNDEGVNKKENNSSSEEKEDVEQTDEAEGLKSKKHGKNHISETNNIAYSTKKIRENLNNVDYKGKKIAFLTFDDGVNTKITTKILDTLEEKGVHATFFIPGNNLSKKTDQDVLKKVYQSGHAIAVHSFYHDYGKLYPGRKANSKQIAKEYDLAINKMKEILGEDFNSKVWRYPGGHMSWNKKSLVAADKALADKGVEWIDWNTLTGDAQPKKVRKGDIAMPTTVDEVLANFKLSTRYTGNPDLAVILMHDSAAKTITAKSLGPLIDDLKNQGYEFGILE